MVSVLLVAVGLYLTNDFNRDQISLQRETTQEQQDLALKGQRADRFVAAVEQLGQEGADKLSIRLGGIYALETLMRDSPEDENTIIEVLNAFVRTHAPRPKTIPTPIPNSPTDVRAAVTVLGRRPDPGSHARLDLNNSLLGLHGVDLSNADLSNADLSNADLSNADLYSADLTDADLTYADLTTATLSLTNLISADLSSAQLSLSHLEGAHLERARLVDTHMTNVYLIGAHLDGAQLDDAGLFDADFTDAELTRADLTRTDLSNADLTRADLSGADLSGANLVRANVASDQVACSKVDASTRLPANVVRPAEDAWRATECFIK